MKWICKYAWAMWISICLSLLGWNLFTWQFYAVFVPLVILVSIHDDTLNVGVTSRQPEHSGGTEKRR
jgi:hypothetical protein